MATDDEGHVTAAGLGGGGLFAFNDQKLRNEYGYESEQALYEVSREIIKDYYGVYPDESYYNGCSDGGREAMEMAERYPDDFNGIIAGAPEIIAGPLNAENQTWDVRVNTDANGNAILTDNMLALAPRRGDQRLRRRRRDQRRDHHRPAGLLPLPDPASIAVPGATYTTVPDGGAGDRRARVLRRTDRSRGAACCTRAACPRLGARAGRSSSCRPAPNGGNVPTTRVARLLRAVAAVPALPAKPRRASSGPIRSSGSSPTRISTRCSRRRTRADAMDTNLSAFHRARRQADHVAGMGRQRHPAVGHGRLLRHADPADGWPGFDGEVRASVPVPDRLPLRRRLRERHHSRPDLSDGAVGRAAVLRRVR